MIHDPAHPDQATHCPLPIAFQGIFTAPNGKRYRVQACEDHADELNDRRPIGVKENGQG